MATDLETALLDVAQKHGRYKPNAYRFTLDAVHFTVKGIGHSRHVSGEELLEGIRRLALERFGPMAKTVFEHHVDFKAESGAQFRLKYDVKTGAFTVDKKP